MKSPNSRVMSLIWSGLPPLPSPISFRLLPRLFRIFTNIDVASTNWILPLRCFGLRLVTIQT